MVGFSMKKKESGDGKKQGFTGFKLGKNGNGGAQKKAKKPFGFTRDEEDEVKEQKIDTFDSNDGAFNKEDGPKKADEPLVIKNQGNDWRTKAKEKFNPSAKKEVILNEDDHKKTLQYGINYNKNENPKDNGIGNDEKESQLYKEDIDSRPEETTSEDYEKIPVESFGAAMLRGMGWSGEEEEKKDSNKSKPVIPVAQRTLYLGLGAKDDGKERDLTPVDKSYVPVKLIKRVSTDEKLSTRKREASPTRGESSESYRSR